MAPFDLREQPGPVQGPSCDVLVCIYTCEPHRPLLTEFYQSAVGRFLLTWPGSDIREIYARPDIDRSYHHENRVIVRAPERYDALPRKTYEMVRYCTSAFRFSRMLKIDVTVVQRHFEEPEYAGRKPIDLTKLIRFVIDSPADSDYAGFRLHAKARREDAESWASKKGLVVDYERFFGDGLMPPFFSGKAYFLSQAFAAFISRNGADIAREHAAFFPGAEDLMVGRLFREFETQRRGRQGGSNGQL